jgi:PliI/PliC-like inhibitor of I-type lysozyme
MRRGASYAILALALAIALAGCSKGKKKDAALAAGGVRAEVEVPVGEAASIGTYTIQISMPHGKKQTLEARRDGSINGRWVADLTGDNVPEIIVWTTSAGSGSHGSAQVFERRGDQYVPRPLADLDPELLETYQGHDMFEVTDGVLHRRFPEYASTDPNASPSGSVVRLRYSFTEDRWIRE